MAAWLAVATCRWVAPAASQAADTAEDPATAEQLLAVTVTVGMAMDMGMATVVTVADTGMVVTVVGMVIPIEAGAGAMSVGDIPGGAGAAGGIPVGDGAGMILPTTPIVPIRQTTMRRLTQLRSIPRMST